MRNRFLPVFAFAFALFVGNSAHAQFASASDTAPAAPALSFGQNNTQLKTILALQGQLQLLRSLIDHERAVNQMVEAATAIGISDPAIPKPDRSLCGEVPSNIPCAQAYEGLYQNYSVAKKKAEPASMPSLPKIDTVIASAVDKFEKTKKIIKEVVPEVELSALYWMNITCLNNSCSALISGNPNDPKASYRIKPGETLPDGSVIQTISANGITALRNKKTVQLSPAPKSQS